MNAQNESEVIEGKVSFITSKNIYVKFTNTDVINIGDTLNLHSSGKVTPCLIVRKKSSTSCVCESINNCEANKEDMVSYEIPRVNLKLEALEETLEIEEELKSKPEIVETPAIKDQSNKKKERIRGRLSAASYSSWPSERDAKHRMMYRMSMNASNIRDSKWSAESYINFRQNFDAQSLSSNTLRIYNLAVRYDVDSTFTIVGGRKINNKASSLGAIDGLQAEKHFGNYYAGAIIGFRPDLIEFNFNPNLLEYGAYGGYTSNTKKIYSQTTFGLLEQRNMGQVDRRYTYFQHSSTINRKLNLFASFEIDLFNKINGEENMDFRITNFYVSARYRFSRIVNLTLSYDSRRRIIFYETLKTDIERLLDDDQARQGVRLRLNIKPYKYINTGLAYSRRFLNNTQEMSDNINAFLSLGKLPVGGRMSFNYNHNNSSYLKSQILSVRHSRSMFKNKLYLDLYYRNVDYTYLTNETRINQNYFGAGFTFRLNRKWMFNFLGELSTRESQENYRLNTKIINRFGKR